MRDLKTALDATVNYSFLLLSHSKYKAALGSLRPRDAFRYRKDSVALVPYCVISTGAPQVDLAYKLSD